MENDTEGHSETDFVNTLKLNIQDNRSMAPKKKSKFSRPFFIALFLVIIILGVYSMRARPKKDLTEKMHNEWVKTMTKESDLPNDSVGLRHFERHEVTQPGQSTDSEQTRVSMVLPAEIPEDVHRAQTEGMPFQRVSDETSNNASTKTTIQNPETVPKALIEMKLDNKESDGSNQELRNNAEYKNAYDEEDGENVQANEVNDDDNDEYHYDEDDEEDEEEDYEDGDDKLYKNVAKYGQYNNENAVGTSNQRISVVGASIEKEDTANISTSHTISVKSQYNKDDTVQNKLMNMQLKPVNYYKQATEPDNYDKPDPQNVHYANSEQVNYVKPGYEQNVDYNKPQQDQINYETLEKADFAKLRIEQANYVQPDQIKMSFANPEQAHIEQDNYAKQELLQMNNANADQARQEIERADYVKQEQVGYVQPEIKQENYVKADSFIENDILPSYKSGSLNSYNQQLPGLSNSNVGGNVASDTRAQFQVNGQNENVFDSQMYQNGYGDSDRKVGKQLFNIDINQMYQTIKRPSTQSAFTLSDVIESRMKIHKVLKDMHDIVDYGSAKSDEDNKKPWNEEENREHLYDLNHKLNLFGNLRMQVNLQAEPVTGTKPIRPPYKSFIQYPDYLTPINWETSFEYVKTPTFECVPMKTIDKYIRICIHPPTVRSQVSIKLKAEASWEYSALMDMQKALLQNKDAVLIDIGASFGVFSLAAAALNRHVIAVEPYPSHIQVLKQSVALNMFRNHITLFQAVISDRRGKVLIKPLDDQVDNIYIQTVEDDEQASNYTLVVNTVTLDDIEKICPGRVAVLKIDIPGFEKRALEYSHFFFKYIYVTHVFMHWNTNDKGLCLFVTRFFVERGYQPYSDLNGSARLDIPNSASWTNDVVIWKL